MKPPTLSPIRTAARTRCLAAAFASVVCLGALSGCATLGPMAGDHPEPAPPDNRPLNEKIGEALLVGPLVVLEGVAEGMAKSGFHYSFSP